MSIDKKVLLALGGLLILLGLLKPEFSNVLNPRPSVVDVLELPTPTDEAVKKEADDVVALVKESGAKSDAKRLRDLYIDLAKLV
jgi:hypothetical protein